MRSESERGLRLEMLRIYYSAARVGVLLRRLTSKGFDVFQLKDVVFFVK